MDSFTKVTGAVLPIDRPNVDTDQIVPARFLKLIDRQGWGAMLFYDWRYLADGEPNPDFIMNQPGYENPSILVAGRNFGSGSSREHAVWAVAQHGIRAVITSSIAEIFHKNSFENGLVPVLLPQEQVDYVMRRALESPGYELTVDLERCQVYDNEEFRTKFALHGDPATHEFRRYTLMHGLDEVALTLSHESDITSFEAQRPPWLTPATAE